MAQLAEAVQNLRLPITRVEVQNLGLSAEVHALHEFMVEVNQQQRQCNATLTALAAAIARIRNLITAHGSVAAQAQAQAQPAQPGGPQGHIPQGQGQVSQGQLLPSQGLVSQDQVFPSQGLVSQGVAQGQVLQSQGQPTEGVAQGQVSQSQGQGSQEAMGLPLMSVSSQEDTGELPLSVSLQEDTAEWQYAEEEVPTWQGLRLGRQALHGGRLRGGQTTVSGG